MAVEDRQKLDQDLVLVRLVLVVDEHVPAQVADALHDIRVFFVGHDLGLVDLISWLARRVAASTGFLDALDAVLPNDRVQYVLLI